MTLKETCGSAEASLEGNRLIVRFHNRNTINSHLQQKPGTRSARMCRLCWLVARLSSTLGWQPSPDEVLVTSEGIDQHAALPQGRKEPC